MKTTKLILSFIALTLASVNAMAQITQTFVSFGAITVPAGQPGTTIGNASPYPSGLTVSGVSGTITDVNVILYDIGHTFPDDVDIILVSPTGQAVTLMSDCGGSIDITGVQLTFDDAAGSGLPDGTIILSGTYLPTDFTTPDNYPTPGPGGVSPPALLSTFNGYLANGTWSLYVVDDESGDFGAIGQGFDLVITTTGCELVLPSGATDENEVCGTNTNDGTCFYSSPYGNISCGETVVGTQFFISTGYDSDGFQFTVTEATNVNITYNSEYPILIGIIDNNTCSAEITEDLGTSCSEQTLTVALLPGIYSIQMEPSFANSPFFDCGGLANDYYVTLNMDPVAPVITTGGPTTFCQGGLVSLTSTVGASYLWSPGFATTQSINATASGSYSVTTTVNGCAATTSVSTVVTVLPNTAVSFTGLNAPFCSNNNSVMTLVPSLYGGTFSGPGIVNNGNASIIPFTGFPLAITDNFPAGDVYPVSLSGLVTGTSLGTDVFIGSICFQATHTWVGDLKFTVTSPNGTSVVLFDRPGYTGTGAGCSGNDIDATFIPGTGTEAETVCNPSVPTISGSFTAFAGANLNALNDGSDPNGVWTFTISDNAAADVGTWTGLTFNFGTNGTFNPSIAGVGSHTIDYAFSNCAGCSSASSQTITVSAPPATPTISGTASFCTGGSTTLTSSVATSYLWSPGGATTQARSVTSAGDYSVTVTNGSGCSATSATTTVTVNSLPATPTISGTASFCTGGSTTLTSSAATSYLWSPGSATTQALPVSSAGDYSVTVTNGSGCSATSATTTVTVNPLPATPTITPSGATTFCDPGSVTLTSSSSSSYAWSPGAATTQAITADATGSYTVTVTDGNGCVSAASAATSVTEENCTGIDNASAINGLNIFPNPASESLNIEFTSNEVTCLEVRMTNTMGQLVYSDVKTTFSGTYKNTFSVVGFATGNYNLQVITDKEMMNKKVIIK